MRTALTLASLTLVVGGTARTDARSRSADDVLARSATTYAALQSYADAGTMVYERPGTVDRYRFHTFFRRVSHDLFFEWQGVSSYTSAAHFTADLSSHRTVIWMAQSDMQKYDAETGVLDHFPSGSDQAGVLTRATSYTRGVSTLIPSMLYEKTALVSTLRELEQTRGDGIENVGGRPCHRLVGVASEHYGATGRVVNTRQVTVWVDTTSLLIRKVVEESPTQSAVDSYRLTIEMQPEANPKLDAGKFQFAVPSRR